MLIVGLTGNVAAGKSSVARWFGRWGATVIDADALVKEVQQPGTPTVAAIARRFGPDVLRSDGSLDRDALRERALRTEDALLHLNAIVHPEVQRLRRQRTDEALARGARIVVNDIPLLFEVLEPGDFDLVVLVDAPVELRRERLMHRGLAAEQADRLIASQLSAEEKRERSDIVIDNTGSLEDLRRAAHVAWQRILARAADSDGGG